MSHLPPRELQWWLRAVRAVGLAALCFATPLAAEPLPDLDLGIQQVPVLPETGGAIITADNLSAWRPLIVPELLPLVRSGAVSIEAHRKLAYQWRIDDGWEKRSIESARRFTATNVAAGLPKDFRPERALPFGGEQELAFLEEQADLPWRILWNSQAVLWSQVGWDLEFDLGWYRRGRDPVRVRGHHHRLYPGLMTEGGSRQLFRERIEYTLPEGIAGLAWLTFRFFGDEEDSLWLYSPAIRKVRQLTGSNRSDSMLRSGVSPDDLLLWSGKVELVEPRLDKIVEAFVPFPELNVTGALETKSGCFAVQPEEYVDLLPAKRGSQMARAAEAEAQLWLSGRFVFVPRTMWRLELAAKDPYSLYGRQVLYVDRASMLPVYKFVYDRSGHLWKTVIGSFGLAATSNQALRFPWPSTVVIVNHREEETSIVTTVRAGVCDGTGPAFAADRFNPHAIAPAAVTPTPQPKARRRPAPQR